MSYRESVLRALTEDHAATPEPRGDKPRLVVVVHPDIYVEIQEVVTSFGHGDVLVQRNEHVPPKTAYVMPGELVLGDMGPPLPPFRWGRS